VYVSIQEDGQVIYECPDNYRVWDYHGTFWSLDSYDFWTLSSDVGMYCYIYDEGAWRKGWQIDYEADAWVVTIGGTAETKTILMTSIAPEVIAYQERIHKIITP